MTDTPEEDPTELVANTAEVSDPLDSLLASIRAAAVADASLETRAIGATACRSLLAALEAKPGQPLTTARSSTETTSPTSPASPMSPTSATSSTSPITALLAELRSMPRDEMQGLLKQLVASPASPLNGILAQLAQMPRPQLIDLVNQQLRALAPAGTPMTPPSGPRFHLIPIPQASRRGRAP